MCVCSVICQRDLGGLSMCVYWQYVPAAQVTASTPHCSIVVFVWMLRSPRPLVSRRISENIREHNS